MTEFSEIQLSNNPEIDFDNPPYVLEDYSFGDKVTRNNFASFLVDSFARARGKLGPQVYATAWISKHTDFDLSKVLHDFLYPTSGRKIGVSRLATNEVQLISQAYSRVNNDGHKQLAQVSIDQDTNNPLPYMMNPALDQLDVVLQNIGGYCKKDDENLEVLPLDEKVLVLEKSDFLEWLRTVGREKVVAIDSKG